MILSVKKMGRDEINTEGLLGKAGGDGIPELSMRFNSVLLFLLECGY